MKRFLLTLFLASGLLLVLSGSPVFAGGIALVGETSRFYELSAGEFAEGTITVKNDGQEPVTVRVKPFDFVPSEESKGRFSNPGASARSNAAWISLSPQSLTIIPGERGHVRYTVRPPADMAGAKGLFWCVLMVEPDEPLSVQKDERSGLAIKTMVRYAVRIMTQLNEPGSADLEIYDRELKRVEKGAQFVLKVRNTGERLLKPSARVELFGASGEKMGVFNAQAIQILPGFSNKFEFQLGKLAVGDYRALVIVDNGDDAVFAADYAIQVPAP